MAQTKIDVINGSYSQLRISGLTVNPSPEIVQLALDRLEDMMAELEDGRNICVGYNFEEEPDPNSLTNVDKSYSHMMKTNLSVRLIPDFNKAVPQTLQIQASQSLSTASSMSAAALVREVQYPRRMARGSGNTLRFNRWQRFQRPEPLPPASCATNKLIIGDINTYTESYSSYLRDTEQIASYVLSNDPGLSVTSSTNNTPVIDYTVSAVNNSTRGIWQQVKIVITTTLGRVETRRINFQIESNKTVGAIG